MSYPTGNAHVRTRSSNFILSNIKVEKKKKQAGEERARAARESALSSRALNVRGFITVLRKQSGAPGGPSDSPPRSDVFIAGLAIPLHKLFCFEGFEAAAPGGSRSRACGSFTLKLKTEPAKGLAER